jgi:hypothetical protein
MYAMAARTIVLDVKIAYGEIANCRDADHAGRQPAMKSHAPAIAADSVPNMLHSSWYFMWMADLTMSKCEIFAQCVATAK